MELSGYYVIDLKTLEWSTKPNLENQIFQMFLAKYLESLDRLIFVYQDKATGKVQPIVSRHPHHNS